MAVTNQQLHDRLKDLLEALRLLADRPAAIVVPRGIGPNFTQVTAAIESQTTTLSSLLTDIDECCDLIVAELIGIAADTETIRSEAVQNGLDTAAILVSVLLNTTANVANQVNSLAAVVLLATINTSLNNIEADAEDIRAQTARSTEVQLLTFVPADLTQNMVLGSGEFRIIAMDSDSTDTTTIDLTVAINRGGQVIDLFTIENVPANSKEFMINLLSADKLKILLNLHLNSTTELNLVADGVTADKQLKIRFFLSKTES